jgi:chemotaxis protein CheC
MNNGFVDGWADVLGTTIDVSAPEYVTDDHAEAVLGDSALDASHEDLALVFRNRIEAVGFELDFEHYLVPDHDPMAELLADGTASGGIEHRKLTAFDRMAQRGVGRVADNLSRTAGMDVEVDLRRINFLSLDAIPEGVSDEPHVSVAFSYSGVLSGYLLFLYDEPSAQDLVRSAVGEDADAFDSMGRDAVKELSNIMASGLLDGWANMLEETIDHSTPAYAYDMGAAVIDSLIVGLSERQEFAFVFDTRVSAVDSEFDVEIYAIPERTDLERALARLETDRAEDAPTTAELPMSEIQAGDTEASTPVDEFDIAEGEWP